MKAREEEEEEEQPKAIPLMAASEEMRKGPWTEQEDMQLVCYVHLFGERRWDFIAKVTGWRCGGGSRYF